MVSFILKQDIKELESVQRRMTKLLSAGMKDVSYDQSLRKLNFELFTLVYWWTGVGGGMIEVYTIMEGIYNSKVSASLQTLYGGDLPNSQNLRGYTKKLFKKRSKWNMRKNFFSNSVLNLWNRKFSNCSHPKLFQKQTW